MNESLSLIDEIRSYPNWIWRLFRGKEMNKILQVYFPSTIHSLTLARKQSSRIQIRISPSTLDISSLLLIVQCFIFYSEFTLWRPDEQFLSMQVKCLFDDEHKKPGSWQHLMFFHSSPFFRLLWCNSNILSISTQMWMKFQWIFLACEWNWKKRLSLRIKTWLNGGK